MPEKTDQEILLSGVGTTNSMQLLQVNKLTGALEAPAPQYASISWPLCAASALSLSAGSVTSELESAGVLSASAYGEEDCISYKSFFLPATKGGQALDYIQNQVNCGSCYANSTSDLINALYYLKCGKFSIGLVLQLIACLNKKQIGDMKCKGCGGCGQLPCLLYLQEHGLLQSVRMTGAIDMAKCL